MATKIGNKKINLSIQLLHMKKLFPHSHVHIQRNCLVWQGDLMPTVLSQAYTVRLSYKLVKSPQVNVLKPELIMPEGKRLPHTYSGKRLCLYYPGIGDWRGIRFLLKRSFPGFLNGFITMKFGLSPESGMAEGYTREEKMSLNDFPDNPWKVF